MKRFLMMGALALGLAGVFESSASAFGVPPGIGGRQRRVGRVEGYWLQPSRGPLYDYSTYFATRYPHLPGAAEYQWQAQIPGYYSIQPPVAPAQPQPAPPANGAQP